MAGDARKRLQEAEAAEEHRAAERKTRADRETIRTLKRRLHQVERTLGESERRFDVLAAVREESRHRVPRPSLPKGGRLRAVAGALASDWHVGERVDYGQTTGLNAYNPRIAGERARRFFERLLWLVNVQRAAVEVDTLVLPVLGDMITGYIHEDLRETNWMSPVEEVHFLRGLLCDGLDHLLDKGDFRKIVVPCVWGNHGRTSDRLKFGLSGRRNSFEWMMYADLQDRYRDEERLDVRVSEGEVYYLDVEGYTIRCTHGNSFGYQGGIGGLTIPLTKAVFRWNKAVEADLTVMGHWHQYLDLQHVIVNGSNKGVDARSIKFGFEPEPAQQAFFLFDPRTRRRTLAAPIFVDPSEEWLRRRKRAGR